jgi:hypothetical protein
LKSPLCRNQHGVPELFPVDFVRLLNGFMINLRSWSSGSAPFHRSIARDRSSSSEVVGNLVECGDVRASRRTFSLQVTSNIGVISRGTGSLNARIKRGGRFSIRRAHGPVGDKSSISCNADSYQTVAIIQISDASARTSHPKSTHGDLIGSSAMPTRLQDRGTSHVQGSGNRQWISRMESTSRLVGHRNEEGRGQQTVIDCYLYPTPI